MRNLVTITLSPWPTHWYTKHHSICRHRLHLSPLPGYWDSRYWNSCTRLDQCTDYRISCYVMFTYHGYTCMSCLHITATRACHVYISLLHVHVMVTYHCYTCMSCLHITVTPACYVYISLWHMHVWLSYGYSFMLPVLLFPCIRYMVYACFPLLILLIPLLDTCSRYWYGYSRYWTWYGYSRYWTWLLLICDVWN